MSRRSFTAPFLSLFYWFLMLLRNPPEASVIFWVTVRNSFLFIGYFLRHQATLFFVSLRKSLLKVYFVFRELKYKTDIFGYRGWHIIYFFVRNNLNQASTAMYLRAVLFLLKLKHVLFKGSQLFRYSLIIAYYKAHKAFHILIYAYYALRGAFLVVYYSVRNPIWAMEQRSPRAYRLIGYPMMKAFWFTKYQIQKRLLGLHRGEA